MIAFSAIDVFVPGYWRKQARAHPWSIYVVRADGTGLQRLTDERLHDCTRPRWSPTGEQLIFTSTEYLGGADAYEDDLDGIVDLSFDDDPVPDRSVAHYVIDADGSNLTRLSIPGECRVSWCPGGRIVVIPRYDQDERSLYVIELDGSQAERLQLDEQYNLLDFSCNGRKMLIVKKEHYFGFAYDLTDLPGGRWLYSLDAANSPRPLIEDGTEWGRHWNWPKWSPDGRLIAYQANCDRSQHTLLIIDEWGGMPTKIADIWFMSDHLWSPNGRWLAYLSSFGQNSYCYLRLVDVASAVSHDLVPLLARDEEGEKAATEPAWSPDSSALIFRTSRAEEEDGSCHLYRINRDGTDRRHVINDQPRFESLDHLAWGRDA